MLSTAIAFSLIATAAVWLAGRRDAARDPRLTLLALGLLAVFPLLFFLPKAPLLPPGDFKPVSPGLSLWLPWIWATGVAIASLRLFVALGVLIRWRRKSERIELRDGIDLRLLPGLAGPVAAGIFKPVIFVPEAWHRWTAEVREAVLAHETKHHQRRDPLWRAIGAAACALHWFNPFVGWMARRLAEQCEFACDEALLAEGMPADRYANVLCDLAAPAHSPATALAMAHESGLEARVRRMFSHSPRGSTFALGLLVLLTTLTAVALAVVKRADPPAKPAIPMEEIQLRLDADPFPGN
jgi:beta-lactamase regulating signal transducer with metallopeptidase domain